MLRFFLLAITWAVSGLQFTLAAPSGATKILMGNDDGWAEANIRQLYSDLAAVGYDVLLSAPAYDMSGSGSVDIPLQEVIPELLAPAEFNTVPAGAPSVGNDTINHRLNYVASFPVTAAKYGLQVLAPSPAVWGSRPDIVVSGPNVGLNTGLTDQVSGTLGVAGYAASQGIPAIAFSGYDATQKSYTALQPGDVSHLYSALSIKVLTQVLASGKPYLPVNTFLNINFPKTQSSCTTAEGFKFVLTKSLPIASGLTCGPNKISMPDESTVTSAGCLISVTAMKIVALDIKEDASEAVQSQVQQKLAPLLSCYQS